MMPSEEIKEILMECCLVLPSVGCGKRASVIPASLWLFAMQTLPLSCTLTTQDVIDHEVLTRAEQKPVPCPGPSRVFSQNDPLFFIE
jgi:hypothetical protein